MLRPTREQAVRLFVTKVLAGAGKAPQVALGPVVWNIDPGHDTKCWYFLVSSARPKNQLRILQFKVMNDDRTFVEQARTDLMMEFLLRKGGIVIADFDDELELAKWGEAVAPSERTKKIRINLERERAA